MVVTQHEQSHFSGHGRLPNSSSYYSGTETRDTDEADFSSPVAGKLHCTLESPGETLSTTDAWTHPLSF